MAELAVTTALALAEIFVIPVLEKSNIFQTVEGDMDHMKSWLRTTKAFLEDNAGHEGGKMLEDYMKKAREIAYEIEDVLDEFVLHSPLYLFHKHGISQKVHHSAHQVKHKFPLRGISDKIAGIKKSIEEFKSQRQTFPKSPSGDIPSSSSNSRILHHVSPLLFDHEMVGYEDQRGDFIHTLEDRDMRRLVNLAVVGPSGSGKTTFVKNVYWKKEIRAQFDCHAWVHVGRHHDVNDIFGSLLKQLGLRNDSFAIDRVIDMLRNYLHRKRYVVVLDDIWAEEDWNAVKNSFPDASEGSRIIVTTRSLEVASVISSLGQDRLFTLQGLEWLQGWILFCRKAFSDINGECPSELQDCSVRIVKRCEGLPLAIVAVGGALARKRERRFPDEWEKFHKNLECEKWKDSFNLKVILDALLPDYMDLHSNLKNCFLYFCMFPEDYSIQRGRLMRLWVAEGFAKGTGDRTAEEVAEGYLGELINRNLIHVSDWDFDGRPRNCRVLNLVLKFVVRMCEDENFASIFNREYASKSQKIRRLSLHQDLVDNLPQNAELRGVRSIFLMRLLGMSASDFNNHLRNMKWLKVLDFQVAPLTEFPKSIRELTLIKYLCFRGTNIKVILSFIERLSYLETLDLKQTEVTELPQEISHLHNLCHLFAYKYYVCNYVIFDLVQGVKMHDGITSLTKLQDVSLVKVGKRGRILKDLIKLRQLRKLGLTGLRQVHGKDLCAVVDRLESLRTLDVCTITKEEPLELGEVKTPPRTTLQRLSLKGRLRELPVWIWSLDNLLSIALKWSKLQHSPLSPLGKLPNLLKLELVDFYEGEELIFESSCFRRLKILAIEEMVELHTIVIQDGAMPDLKELSLLKCPALKMCPLGIEQLLNVEKLNLYDMDSELVARLGKNGEDHAMVEHISSINCCSLVNGSGPFVQNSAGFSLRPC